MALPSEKQGRFTTWKCVTEKRFPADGKIIAQNYNNEIYGDNGVLNCNRILEEDLQEILRADAKITVTSLKKG